MNPEDELRRIKAAVKALTEAATRQADRIATLETAAVNQSARINAVDAKTQRVNQSITLTANIPLDVTVLWPNPWPDTFYGIYTQLTTGNLVLGSVHATPRANSKTTTQCVVTVLSTVDVASAGLDVLGART